MTTMRIRVKLTEGLLGTASSIPDIHSEYIASKAPDAPSREEEIAALGAEAVEEKGTTVFPRDEDGNCILWDYQLKGFFKDACGGLRRADGTKSAGLKAYKKEIDNLIFPAPRKIVLHSPTPPTLCQRPLRAQTAQGERVALASSEELPAGTWFECDIEVFKDDLLPLVREWLDYGQWRGIGQWRNSGKGRFEWEEL